MRVNNLAISVLTFALALAVPALADSVSEYVQDPSTSNNTGKIVGKVWASGNFQRPRPLKVFKNRIFCGSSVPDETLLINREGGLRNAVVTLSPLDRVVTLQPGRIILDNKQCAFVPHVQVAVVDSELLLKNSDPILHTVHARLGNDTLFNVGLPKWRQVAKSLRRAGVIRIDCDVLHTWMSAVIIVTSTPYHSVTDENGYFTVHDLPAGVYEMEVWHERLGTKSAGVSVAENLAVSLDVVYALNHGKP